MEGGFVVCKVSQGWGQTRHQLVHPPEPALHINPAPVTPQSIPCPLQGVQVPPGQGTAPPAPRGPVSTCPGAQALPWLHQPGKDRNNPKEQQ